MPKNTATLAITADQPVQGRWLILARAGWVAFLSLVLWLMAWSLPFANLNLRFDQVISDSYNLFSEYIGLSGFVRILVAVQYAIALFYILIGCVIFLRKSDDRIALLTSLGLVCLPYIAYFTGLVFQIHPGGLYGRLLYLAEGLTSTVAVLTILLLLLTFPDGKTQPAWVSRTLRFLILPLFLMVVVVPIADLSAVTIGAYSLGDLAWAIGFWGAFLIFILGGFSQVYKYARVSSPLQRQQTKWVLFSLVIAVSWSIIAALDPGRRLPYELRGYYGLAVAMMNLLVFGFIPLAFALSLFRYRLYDIDLIIRRTLQYGLLTGLLAGLYFVVIVVMQAGLAPRLGQDRSPIVIVVSTLSIAALFNPLRVRIQAFIDRRFFRKKYDAERTLAEFGISIRSEVDLEHLSMSLLEVVQTTLQPDRANLWLVQEKQERLQRK